MSDISYPKNLLLFLLSDHDNELLSLQLIGEELRVSWRVEPCLKVTNF